MADETPYTMVGDTKVPLRPPIPEPAATTFARLIKPLKEQLDRIELLLTKLQVSAPPVSKDKAK